VSTLVFELKKRVLLTLLTFGQSLTLLTYFSKKTKVKKYHGAKLGYDTDMLLGDKQHFKLEVSF
jgi:hypothetical protein